ncbi:MAG TPA: LacI family DNA-binding transcriptional regulator [Micromonosporaceae bacterium]|nr:LacI family DNA-binding transcriptional regulator [Micromonosporaceae bacterium]
MNQAMEAADRPSPTVADVADTAGVSRQTVSNVLNAPQRVRPETRARVEEAIATLGYLPNRAARALRVQASQLIGYRVEPVHEESLASIHDRFLHALAEAGREADHHLLLFTADDAEDELAACARLYRAGGVDGFVLYGIGRGDPRPQALLRLGAPFAAFGRTDFDAGHPWVDVDNAAGTAAAVDHLVARGHRRVAFLGWPEGSQVGDHRATGWRTALDKHGLLAESAELDIRGEDSVAGGAALASYLLDRDHPPTAIVAVSDTLAVGAAQAARVRGRSLGRDLAVVGFDDTPTARVLDLSSVRQPIEAVGRAVIRALIEMLPAAPPAAVADQVDAPPTGRLVAPALVVRASSAAPVHR